MAGMAVAVAVAGGMAGIVGTSKGSDDQAEMGLIWSSGGNSNDISVIAGMGMVIVAGMGMVIAGMGMVIVAGMVIAGIGMVIIGIVAGMVAGTRPVGDLAFRPSFFRCMSCSK